MTEADLDFGKTKRKEVNIFAPITIDVRFILDGHSSRRHDIGGHENDSRFVATAAVFAPSLYLRRQLH